MDGSWDREEKHWPPPWRNILLPSQLFPQGPPHPRASQMEKGFSIFLKNTCEYRHLCSTEFYDGPWARWDSCVHPAFVCRGSSPSLTQSWAGTEGWHPTSSILHPVSCKPSVGSQGAVWQQDVCCQAGQAVRSAVDEVIEKAAEQSGGMKSKGAVVPPTAPNGLCTAPVIDAGGSG